MQYKRSLNRISALLSICIAVAGLSGSIQPGKAEMHFRHDVQINKVSIGVQASPSIAAFPNGTFGVVWHDSRNQTAFIRDYDIYFATLEPNSLEVSTSIRVNNDFGNSDQTYPRVAIGKDGSVHVVWVDVSSGTSLIYYSRSPDGLNFTPGKPVNASIHAQIQPSMALDEAGDPHVVWEDLREGDPDIYYASSTDQGKSFGPAIRIDDDTGAADQGGPQIAVRFNDSVWVAWADFRNDIDGKWLDSGGFDGYNDIDVYLRCRFNDSWTTGIRVNQDQTHAAQNLGSIAILGRSAVVSWTDYRNDVDGYPKGWPPYGGVDGVNNGDIYVAVIDENATSVRIESRANDDIGLATQDLPSLATTNDTVHVVWCDKRIQSSDWDVYYAAASTSDLSFSRNIRVHGDAGGSIQTHPYIAIADIPAIVWTDNRTDSEMDVFCSVGIEWSQDPIALISAYPFLVAKGSDVIFDASASSDPDGVIVDYAFDYGDASNISGPLSIVHHAYMTAGSYNVTLTVTDDDGNRSSTETTVTVVEEAAQATFPWWILISSIFIAILAGLFWLFLRRSRKDKASQIDDRDEIP